MKILSVTLEQNSGCAIFINNKIVFAASQERYSRRKSDESFPLDAINDGLKYCKIKPSELDQVIIATNNVPFVYPLLRIYSNFSIKDHLFAMEKYWYPKLVKKENPSMLEIFKNKIDYNQYPFNSTFASILDYYKLETKLDKQEISHFYKKALSNHLNIDESKIIHLDHHSCHAAYALYASPIREDRTLIFTADAEGDGLSATISIFDKNLNKIERLKEYPSNDFQLARIYRYTTLLLKMLPNEHEYKVMGLAPYYDGMKIKEVEEVFGSMQKINEIDFKFNSNISDIFHYLETNLREFRFDHIAAGLQSFTEKILVEWIKNATLHFKSDHMVFSGGTSMNVKANLKISQLPQIKKFFVCGGGGDETLPLGACYLYAESQNIHSEPLADMYLGPEYKYSDEDILKFSEKYRITKFEHENQIVDKILNGDIIASCFGRMEMGPRSLCNRSILADPRNRQNVEKINRKIKSRDFWMPFAPVILDEYQHEIIINPKKIESPYMTIAFETINGKEKIPAAVHQYDGTARAMILKKEMNPRVWGVIKKFYDKTGIPALVNTSFNLHGEPIVNTINDAFHVFENSGLDILWLERHIIEKER